MPQIESAVAAAIANLHEQAVQTGCTMEDNGSSVQIDGSFEIELLVRAILAVAGQE